VSAKRLESDVTQHGPDGLSNISETHPHFTPPATAGKEHAHLEISAKPAYEVMLDLLRSEDAGTVTIVAMGPCGCDTEIRLMSVTNVAHALRSDPETFNRVAEVVWMGGALDVHGNTSPTAEFNCFADPVRRLPCYS
jgi:inosine-uridine nucleoside N-ribohydrolase